MRASVRIAAVVRRLLRETDGPTAVEYAVLLGLIILVAAAAARSIGQSVFGLWAAIDTAVSATG